MTISVKCKRCGRPAPADKFVLDAIYKMMVCPTCIKERRDGMMNKQMKEKQMAEKAQEMQDKPRDWDSDDAVLEKLNRQKQAEKVQYEWIDDTRIKYVCQKCKYKFVYDIDRRFPNGCTFCGTKVANIKF